MEQNIIINSENKNIQQIIESYLRFRSTVPVDAGKHLDEDSLSAFVEGNLSARENNVFASHLSDCGFCLHKTAELAELQMAFASDAPAVSVPEAMPSRISEVISGLFSRLFGQLDSGDAVFAHSEKKENEPAAEDSDESDVKDKDAE